MQEFPGVCFPVELYNFCFVYDVCAPVGVVVFVEPVPFGLTRGPRPVLFGLLKPNQYFLNSPRVNPSGRASRVRRTAGRDG